MELTILRTIGAVIVLLGFIPAMLIWMWNELRDRDKELTRIGRGLAWIGEKLEVIRAKSEKAIKGTIYKD